MKLSDFYEAEYPEHSRTSCSDDAPINAEVSGHGCLRCNAIFFEKGDAAIAKVSQLREVLREAEAALADIGDADREPDDDLAWCERRAAKALPSVRVALAT